MTTYASSTSTDGPAPLGATVGVPRQTALVCLTLTLAAVQFSIAISQIFLTLALLAWGATLVAEHRLSHKPVRSPVSFGLRGRSAIRRYNILRIAIHARFRECLDSWISRDYDAKEK